MQRKVQYRNRANLDRADKFAVAYLART